MVLRTRGLLVRQLTVGRLAQGQALQGRTKMCGTSLPPRPMIIQKPSPPRGTTRFGSPFDAMVEICGKADSLGEVCSTRSAKASVAFVAIKEKIRFEGRQDLQTKVMTTLFAELERELISERTREGLARARASGKKLGRPKGPLGTSRLDGREEENRKLLGLGVSKSAVVEITGVSRPTLYVQLPQHPRHSGIRSAGMSSWRPYTWTLDGAPRCCLSDRIRKCRIWWGNVRKTRRNARKTTRNPPGTYVTI